MTSEHISDDDWDLSIPHEAFYVELETHLNGYEIALGMRLKKPTVNKHSHIIVWWMEFFCVEIGNESFQTVTVAQVNSQFKKWMDMHMGENSSKSFVKTALYGFFYFLNNEKGYDIPNKIMKSLKKSHTSEKNRYLHSL